MRNSITRLGAAAFAAALLAGCGGGGTGSVPAASAQDGLQTVTFAVHVPGSSIQTARGRRPLYTSRDTRGIGVDFRAYNGGSSNYSEQPNSSPQVAQAIAPGASGCSSAGADGGFTCTFSVPGVPSGYDSFRFVFWNAAPSGGNFTAAGDQALSVGVLNDHAIIAGATNSINTVGLTLNPVVYSASVQLSQGIVDGTPDSGNALYAEVTLKDAQGNIILTNDALLDQNGNGISVQVQLTNDKKDSGAACATPTPVLSDGCSLYFNGVPTSFNSSSAASATIHYDGVYSFPTGGASVPGVSLVFSSGLLPGSNIPVSFNVTQSSANLGVPKVPQYSGASAALGASPSFITTGSDGNIYAVNGSGISYFTPCSTLPATCSATPVTVTGTPYGIASGSDGYLWYADTTDGTVVKQPVGAAGTPVSSACIGAGCPGTHDTLNDLVAATDGSVWVLDSTANSVVKIAPNGMTPTSYAAGGTPYINAMAAGAFPSGQNAVCFSTANGPNANINCITTAGSLDTAAAATGATYALAFGPDDLLYAAQSNGHILSYYMSGTTLTLVKDYTLTGGPANSMAAGHDGSLWFSEGGSNVVGRIAIESLGNPPATPGALVEWSNNPGVGFPNGTTPAFMTVDGSGNLWIADTGSNKTVDEVTP